MCPIAVGRPLRTTASHIVPARATVSSGAPTAATVLHVGVEDVDDADREAEAFGGRRHSVVQRRVRRGQTQIVRRRRVPTALLVGSHSSRVARAAQKHLTRPDVSSDELEEIIVSS